MFKLATSFLSKSSRALNERVFNNKRTADEEVLKVNYNNYEEEEDEDDDEEENELDLTMEEITTSPTPSTPTSSSTPEDIIDLTESWSERVIFLI